ncbi:DUF4198 domain-containing protein [Thalassotalea sediminis]|uniref:DUF4198 domain-containing protein n=1 Tax=Thalassotalea sediminis TaxID=1759089 RepID=UPI0025727AC2|nr:DUF4198 domain-containing protein [Thalassotalea sediminis]
MPRKTSFSVAIAALTLLTITSAANAHRVWIKPSKTVLSGEKNYVTFDAAVSNTLFVPEHFPFRTDGIVATAPDGNQLSLENVAQGKYRSTFDLALTQEGTYRIGSSSAGIRAFWEDKEGKRKMWPPRRGKAKGDTFETAVPKNAKNLRVTYSSRKVETFVTLGQPTTKNLQPTNKGLELITLSHPNDLFATEAARFKFLIDGEPAVNAEIEIVPGAMRYRNAAESITLKTDNNGEFSIIWPNAGMYFLEASYKDNKAPAPATVRQGNYAATFEVLPL